MKVIAVTSDKGGMGKSTAALNISCAAVEDGYEVAVLDLDPQASVGRWARVRKKQGLPPRPLAETCVPIDVEDRLAELEQAGADLVFLDTAGRDNNAITAAIGASDLILIPCHPTDLELSTLGPTLGRLRADNKPHYVLLIDWSAGATRRRRDATQAISRAGGRVVPVPYTHRADYRLALENGQGVTEFEPTQTAAREIRGVWQWMKDALSLEKATSGKAA
ncbi:ParA family protein [Roseomonas mucosa]|uniref:ParA family protein n=1 Tax=Roseomonas mucosa TaxID=207340 RepID=UPI0028CBFBDB|nr:ParA family protein [Roseomonas mucosa]MDT8278638.1 ParA family protein [Roseomonas mucosa]